MCFLQKTAPNLVKYGLHSLAYNLPPHIGGRHSVLYFTIQATKKYSNSNVLVLMLQSGYFIELNISRISMLTRPGVPLQILIRNFRIELKLN